VSDDARLDALREMVAVDPSDLMARLLLGRELLSRKEHAEATEHLTAYLAQESPNADTGAAYGALAEALAALGRRQDALTAIAAGILNATTHRHLGLVGSLEEQREALDV
jgi:predicted Zn-dependent protease